MAAEEVPVEPNDRKRQSDAPASRDAAQLNAAQAPAADRVTDLAAGTLAANDVRTDDAWIGRVLDGRYRVAKRLGEGGMGAVFIAEHLKLRKQVALKVIRAELAGNGEVAARFAREAMATAQFEHPHVASATDFGTLSEGGAYLVMQLVRGESLRSLLDRRGALPWPAACELLAQVADALSAARGAGIVHRDLKPENILVETREDGSYLAKILDFGIAHVVQPMATAEAPDRALTRVGTVIGTPGYMSPEQAVGERVDHRTDLYALGVVLWECLTGQPLWEGADVMAIITRQLQEPVPRPRDVLGDPLFPRALDQLVLKLCARSPDERPEHASQVRDELRGLAHQRMTPAGAIAEQAALTLTAARQHYRGLSTAARALLLAASASVLIALFAVFSGRTPSAPAGAPPEVQPPAAAPVAAPQGSRFGRMVEMARGIVREPEPAVPKELEGDVQSLIDGKSAVERRRAATKVLKYKGTERVPPYLLSVARLEKAKNCRDRNDAIDELDELQDPRTLPAVKRIAEAARNGCGFLGLADCYGCVRGAAREVVARLSKSE